MNVKQSGIMLSRQNAATFCNSTNVKANVSEREVSYTFCSSIIDQKVQFKIDHPYYHQVQFQLL